MLGRAYQSGPRLHAVVLQSLLHAEPLPRHYPGITHQRRRSFDITGMLVPRAQEFGPMHGVVHASVLETVPIQFGQRRAVNPESHERIGVPTQ